MNSGAKTTFGKGPWQNFFPDLVVQLLVLGIASTAGLLVSTFKARFGVRGILFALIATACAYVLLRLFGVDRTIHRLLNRPPEIGYSDTSVFVGPVPYLEEDRFRFYGRERESEECLRQIRQWPVYFIEGESGCGKTSFINAALVPRLESFWSIRHLTMDAPTVEGILAGTDKAQSDHVTAGTSLLCIDHFETLAIGWPPELQADVMRALLAQVRDSRSRLLLSFRTEFLGWYFRLCEQVDPDGEVLRAGAGYTLRAFSPDQAEQVLARMLGLGEMDGPVAAEVRSLSKRIVGELLRPANAFTSSGHGVPTVLPLELQLVGSVLQSTSAAAMLADLERIGGHRQLLGTYLEAATAPVERVPGLSRAHALRVLSALVAKDLTRRQADRSTLASELDLPIGKVTRIIDVLEVGRLVRRVPRAPVNEPSDAINYELSHDYLIPLLQDAPDPQLESLRNARALLAVRLAQARQAESRSARTKWYALIGALKPGMPLMEAVRLRRYATTAVERELLDRNVKRGLRRYVCVFAALAVLVAGGVAYLRTNYWQAATLVAAAPVDEAAIQSLGGASVVDSWITNLYEVGRKDDAIRAAMRIRSPGVRAAALCQLAETMHSAGDDSSAKAIVDDVVEQLDDLGIRPSIIPALDNLIYACGIVGDTADVLLVARGISEVEDRRAVLGHFVSGLVNGGHEGKWRAVLAEEADATRSNALVVMHAASVAAADDDCSNARRLLQEGFAIATADTSQSRGWLWNACAALTKCSQFEEAVALAREETDLERRGRLLIEIALNAYEARDSLATDTLLRQGLDAVPHDQLWDTTRGHEHLLYVIAMTGLTDVYISNLDVVRGAEQELATISIQLRAIDGRLDEAVAIADSIGSMESRAEAYCTIGAAMAIRGRSKEGKQFGERALRTADLSDDQSNVAYIRTRVAQDWARMGFYWEALKLVRRSGERDRELMVRSEILLRESGRPWTLADRFDW